MPGRTIPLVTNQYYHIFNRGIDRRTTFVGRRDYKRATESARYYHFMSPPRKFSKFLVLSIEDRQQVLEELKNKQKLVKFICYCLMPNHFHFLVKQMVDDGISKFMSIFQNSYTRYFNTKQERKGPLFGDQFKAVRIETDDQLLHLSRYIHLNPYTSFVIKTKRELLNYEWSSLPVFLTSRGGFCEKEEIIHRSRTAKMYKDFVLNQADYQRNLERIRHLSIDE
jgi:putative transposase